jgi:hypothetical protein
MTTIAAGGALAGAHEPSRASVLRKALLGCGILAAALYAAMLVVVPMRWPSYSSASQTVSELSAIGAPTRALWLALGSIYAPLSLAFALGIWLSAGRRRQLRVAAGALIAQSVVDWLWPPMHLRGVTPTLTDAMHVAFAGAWLLLMLVAMAFGAAALGRRFRLYTLATLAIFVPFGTLTAMDGPRIAANLPTPWVGACERINIGASLAWVVVLAMLLMRRAAPPPDAPPGR